MNTSTWSHFEDLTQTFEMGPIRGLQLYSFRSSTISKLILLLTTVAFLSAKIVLTDICVLTGHSVARYVRSLDFALVVGWGTFGEC